MTRIEKVAVFQMAVVLCAMGATTAALWFTGRAAWAGWGMLLLCGLFPGRWMFKRKGEPSWDERELELGRWATLGGYFIFWFVFIITAAAVPPVVGYNRSIQFGYLAFLPLLGAYIVVMSSGLSVLYLIRHPYPGKLRGVVVCLAIITLISPPPALLVHRLAILAAAPPSRFVGAQTDEWTLNTGQRILARSRITITHLPEGRRTMDIVLPYDNAKLVSASFDGKPIEARELKPWAHELVLPPEFLDAEDRSIDIAWEPPPLGDLYYPIREADTSYSGYRARLVTLIDARHYSLSFVLGRECGFEFAADPSVEKLQLFYAGKLVGRGSMRKFGSCGIPIRRKAARTEETSDQREDQE